MHKKHKANQIAAKGNHNLDMITQADMRQYVEAGEVARTFDRFRERLIERLQQGTPIEPGPLHATLELQDNKQLSWSMLESQLDPEVFTKLNATYQGKKRRRVLVTEFGRPLR